MPPSSLKRRYSSPCLPLQHETSAEDTPSSNGQLPSALDVNHEYSLVLRSNSCSKIWSNIHCTESSCTDEADAQAHEEQKVSNMVLSPSRERVQEALQNARPNTLTDLMSAYFDHSESTFHLCLNLHNSVNRARYIYFDIGKIVNCFPLDSDAYPLTESQCGWAFNVFLQFNQFDNPFPQPGFLGLCVLRGCLSVLYQQLHDKVSKSRSRVHLFRWANRCSVHDFVGALLPSCHPSRITKKELSHLSQLNAAARGSYVFHHLDTIDRLLDLLHSSFEGDKFLVRLVLERGRDWDLIHEVAKELKRTHPNFLAQLADLEEQLCLCFAAVSKARSLLLEEIDFYQSWVCG